MDATQVEAIEKGWLRNMFWRKRHFHGNDAGDEWVVGELERQAINFPCASTVSDIVSRACANIEKEFEQRGWTIRWQGLNGLVMSLHDGIYYELHPDIFFDACEIIKRNLEIEYHGLSIPVDLKAGPTWGDCKKLKISLTDRSWRDAVDLQPLIRSY